jgi:hypothetical protein
MQHACAILSSVACIAPHYLINGKIFVKSHWTQKCVFWLSLQHLTETFLILRRTELNWIQNVYRYSCKVPFIVIRFKWKSNFLADFRKIPQYQMSLKFAQWKHSCSMRTDRRTDMTKLIVTFLNFARAPKNQPYLRQLKLFVKFCRISAATALQSSWNNYQ